MHSRQTLTEIIENCGSTPRRFEMEIQEMQMVDDGWAGRQAEVANARSHSRLSHLDLDGGRRRINLNSR